MDHSEVVVESDTILTSADQQEIPTGKFIRKVRFGVEGHRDYPTRGNRYAPTLELFVETDSSGQPLSEPGGLALFLTNSSKAPAGYTIECALTTNSDCVVGGIGPAPQKLLVPYPNQFHPQRKSIEDSNVLFFNAIYEAQYGLDAYGQTYKESPLKRIYIYHLAVSGLISISASVALGLELNLFSQPPDVVIGGHSKWAAAASQVAMFDERVKGAALFGYPMNFLQFLELGVKRWEPVVSGDFFDAICPEERPCAFKTLRSLLNVFT